VNHAASCLNTPCDLKKKQIFIGTSGWSYDHWKGVFYPEVLPQKKHFDFYQRYFDTVELNNPFYRLPSEETFASWKNHSKTGFIFSVKANRFITHMKKLKDPESSLEKMLAHTNNLGRKLGPVLFQLPPRWKKNTTRFTDFLNALPAKGRFVFEFRETSWYDDDIFALLEEHNCAFCIYQLAGHRSPEIVTADFVYIRLHGPAAKYQGNYNDRSLQLWSKKIIKWTGEGKDVYVYFDNDQSAFAVKNALRLKKLCSSHQHF
jgi:uncharacterized protein YecE (DUF72 family)